MKGDEGEEKKVHIKNGVLATAKLQALAAANFWQPETAGEFPRHEGSFAQGIPTLCYLRPVTLDP